MKMLDRIRTFHLRNPLWNMRKCIICKTKIKNVHYTTFNNENKKIRFCSLCYGHYLKVGMRVEPFRSLFINKSPEDRWREFLL